MNDITIKTLGTVRQQPDGRAIIQLDEQYRAGLKGLDGFSHLVVAWWAHKADDPEYRNLLDAGMPYQKVTESLGIFATRSPIRPNPICLSVITVASVDVEAGQIETYYFDAEEATPLLDIKPYTPSVDRVTSPQVPVWCAHWP